MVQLTAVANAVIALAFFAITGLIFVGLVKDRHLGVSPLGVAAAHELKTPVTTIRGWTQMLLRSDNRGADERKALETIQRQSERITRLSEDLIAALRLQPGLPFRAGKGRTGPEELGSRDDRAGLHGFYHRDEG